MESELEETLDNKVVAEVCLTASELHKLSAAERNASGAKSEAGGLLELMEDEIGVSRAIN